MSRAATLALCAALPLLSGATLGLDFSQAVSVSAAQCMVKSGYSFAVTRAWRSFGGWDTNCPFNAANLWAGGFAHVDVYMFVCAGQSASTQANALMDKLAANRVKYGMVWVDIEANGSPGCGWSMSAAQNATGGLRGAQEAEEDTLAVSSPAGNCAYIGQVISALRARGANVGTYTSNSQWSVVAGSSCTVASSTPIWYAHYDSSPVSANVRGLASAGCSKDEPSRTFPNTEFIWSALLFFVFAFVLVSILELQSFSDWRSFGGWTKPAIKQFADGPAVCGVGADHNFY